MNTILLSSTGAKGFWELIGVLLIFLAVLAITYLTTRWMGGVQKKRVKNKNLQLIETIAVGNNKMISIVAVGKRYFVVSIGKEDVRMIAEVAEEDLTDLSFMAEGEQAVSVSFQDIFSKIKDNLPKK